MDIAFTLQRKVCRTIVALPVVPFTTDAVAVSPVVSHSRFESRVVGACLLILLVFTTSTVFVKQAWALQTFQIGIFALLGIYLLTRIRKGSEGGANAWPAYLIYIVPFWGLIQIVGHFTSSAFETRAAVLRWGALAGVFFLTVTVGRTRSERRNLLSAFLIFATAMAVLCMIQLFTSEGKVLWLFDSGYPDVYATFASYNNFAQFIELALPIALWRALREGWKSWWYVLSGGLLYGSVIGSASRAGAVLCTLEVLAMMLLGLLKLRDLETGQLSRSTIWMVLLVPVLAAGVTLAVGWERVMQRFEQNDPYLVRKEFVLAAIDMAKQKPLTGFGLDTFPAVYQRYAIRDFPFYANHTHNDWVEFAADGGIPFLLLLLIPFAAAIPFALRNPWGIGIIAIMLHACVDFPFPRPAVSGWLFFLLALLYMTANDRSAVTRAAV
jgi:O-antigen ligase